MLLYMKSFHLKSFFFLTLGLGVIISSCVKRDFDEPPLNDEVADLVANTTIDQLKQRFTGSPIQISDDLIIRAIVVADDRSGNYFKSIIVQDESAGIDIQIDRIGLADDYPIGREIFVKCKNLWLGSNNGSIQLGASIDAQGRAQRIPDNLRSRYLFRGRRDQAVVPLRIRIADLNTSHIHRLVQIEDVQFRNAELGKTYANAVAQTSVNLNLEDCDANTILLRTSGFANFAGQTIPLGRGRITAVFSVFGNDRQLFIRDTNDVQMAGNRCGSGGNDLELMSVADVRAIFQGQTTAVPDKRRIRATVISDRVASNITGRNITIQEPQGAGIVVRFTANNTFALGDEIEIDISGVELSEFQGLMQLNNVPNGNARKIGEGNLPQAASVTIAQLLAEFENLESRLVRIANVTITKSSGNTFSGTCVLNDGTGTIDLFTQSYSTFASNEFPTTPVNITAIVSQGGNQNARQLSIRNLSDIEGNGSGSGDLNETFSGVTNNTDLALNGWSNIAEIGTRVWRGQVFSGNGYAQATSFNSPDPVNVLWLITPPIALDRNKVLSFETAMNFWAHNGLEVFVSNNFNGTNVTTANWQKLNPRLATQSDPVNTFIPSGDIDLSAFSGTIRIAFKYSGDNSTNTTTYRVDNVQVRNQ
jgi:hypothetical protein